MNRPRSLLGLDPVLPTTVQRRYTGAHAPNNPGLAANRKRNPLRNDEDRVCANEDRVCASSTQPPRVSVAGSRYGTTRTMFVPVRNGLRAHRTPLPLRGGRRVLARISAFMSVRRGVAVGSF